MDSRADIALSILSSAIDKAGLWADFDTTNFGSIVVSSPLQNSLISNTCQITINATDFGVLPRLGADLSSYAFRLNGIQSSGFNCLDSRPMLQLDSDALFVKGIGKSLASRVDNRVMWSSSVDQAAVFVHGEPNLASELNSRYELTGQLFFIDNYGIAAVPSLKRLYLMRSPASGAVQMRYDAPLVKDINLIRVRVHWDSDTPLDYKPNELRLAKDLSPIHWLDSRIRALQIVVVVRSPVPIPSAMAASHLDIFGETWPIPSDGYWYKAYQRTVTIRQNSQAWSDAL